MKVGLHHPNGLAGKFQALLHLKPVLPADLFQAAALGVLVEDVFVGNHTNLPTLSVLGIEAVHAAVGDLRHQLLIREHMVGEIGGHQILHFFPGLLVLKQRPAINGAVCGIGGAHEDVEGFLDALSADFLVQLIGQDAAVAVAQEHIAAIGGFGQLLHQVGVQVIHYSVQLVDRFLPLAQPPSGQFQQAELDVLVQVFGVFPIDEGGMRLRRGCKII